MTSAELRAWQAKFGHTDEQAAAYVGASPSGWKKWIAPETSPEHRRIPVLVAQVYPYWGAGKAAPPL